jgi:hypothetical protein
MRRIPWMLAGALALTGPASPAPAGTTSFRTVTDASEWCDEGKGDWREVQHCEVREATWDAAGAPLAVDAAPNGGISVVGWDKNEVRLLVKVVASGTSREEARARAAAVRIATDGTIRAVTGNDSRSWTSFRLQVPRALALSLSAHNGGINLEGLTGTVEASTVNGGLHLERMGGNVTARTQNGGLHVDLDGDGWDGEGLSAETANGGVHLALHDGYNAHLVTSTVNGGIHAPAALRERFEGKRLDVELGRGGAPVRAVTRNGGIHIEG